MERSHYKNSIREGKFTLYHENGREMVSGHMKNGLNDGDWNFYYEDGTISMRQLFHNGKLISE